MQAYSQSNAALAEPPTSRPASQVQVLVVVEGINDVEFLRRISRIVHFADPALPDLAELEAQGRLIFLPVGGSDLAVWSHRLAPFAVPEFHLLDKDVSPLTEEHQIAVQAVNHRQGCIAALTGKRHIDMC